MSGILINEGDSGEREVPLPQRIFQLEKASATLFDAIAHGDETHRAWLKQAIEDHFAGRPVLRPDEVRP